MESDSRLNHRGIPYTVVPQLTADHFRGFGDLVVAVFGPGMGESILIRLPDGGYGVVDGCAEPTDSETGHGDPIHELLSALDPPRLSFVCMTHAHQDHYLGLRDLLRRFEKRINHIWWGGERELRFEKAIKRHYQRDLKRGAKGNVALVVTREDEGTRLEMLIDCLEKSLKNRDAQTQSFSDSKRLAHVGEAHHRVKIQGLGPTTYDLHKAIRKGERITREKATNEVSGALLLQWHQTRVLLGGDLLVGETDQQGWRAIAHHVPAPVTLVKVAHHASAEAQLFSLWKRICPSLAVVTPFQHAAGKQPPRPKELNELSSSVPLVVTSQPDWWQQPNHDLQREPIRSPVAAIPPSRRTPMPPSALPVAPPDKRYNAVLVRMNDAGVVLEVILARDAAFYSPASA